MIRKLSKLLAYRQHLRENGATKYQVSFVTEDNYLKVAQRLHAKVYLERNYIDQKQLSSDGRISLASDPYQAHADYFIVTQAADGGTEVIATARQIKVRPETGHTSFPVVEKLRLYPKMLSAIQSLNPVNCVEISGLAKERGHSAYVALLLYRAMWQHSVKSGHQLWLMACDEQVYNRLSLLFGEALIQIGEPTLYMGSVVVPAALEVDQSLNQLLRATQGVNPITRSVKRELIRFFLRGLPTELLTPQHISTIDRISLFKVGS